MRVCDTGISASIRTCPYGSRTRGPASLKSMDDPSKKLEKTEDEQVAEFLQKLSEKYGTDFDEPVPKKLSDLIRKLHDPDSE